MNLTLSDIASAVGAEPIEGPVGDVRATGMTWDSRAVAPGDLYAALPGERVDGHDFADSAVDAGAVAVLANRPLDVAVPVIVVSDTVRALTRLAAHWRDCLTSTVIGVTGSSGKTTTKDLVRDVLSRELSVVATKANQNNELGVPATLLAADADTQAVVVEMGMRGAGQITELAELARPNWGLVTNVGTSHIELLGSREAIAHAKAELYEALPDGAGLAFVNADDDYAAEMCAHARLEERGITAVYFSAAGSCTLAHRQGPVPTRNCVPKYTTPRHDSCAKVHDPVAPPDAPFVWASDVSLDGEGRPSFMLNAVGFEQLELPDANGSHPCTMELRGMHNVSNACAAAAVGLSCGLTLETCAAALEAARPAEGRQHVCKTAGGVTVVDDAYNANPDSMAASLGAFSALDVAGRRVAVLGDMLELGDYAGASHEHVGELVASSGIDRLVCVGSLSRLVASSAIDAGMSPDAVSTCDDAQAALELVRGDLAEGDAVLVKASHSIGLEHVVKGLVS